MTRSERRVSWALGPDGPVRDVVVGAGGIRDARAGDGPARGVALPGFVNGHVHLEIGPPRVPGGQGLAPWVAALRARGEPPGDGIANARDARRLGTAVVMDVSNGGHTAPAIRAAGLAGVVQHEVLGLGRGALASRLAAIPAPRREGEVWIRPSPHAVYSTHPELIRAAAAPGPAPATIHCAEDPGEERFLRARSGPFAELLDGFGVDWRPLEPVDASVVGLLDALGVLPGLHLAHGVHLSAADRARIAARGATVVLCPRSNLHVGGRLPDVPALVAAGIPLRLGTDSRGSVPDLDLLAEVDVLCDAFPELPRIGWLRIATAGGRGWVVYEGDAPDDLRAGTPRAWLEEDP